MVEEQINKQRLIYAIIKFFDGEIQAETQNIERRESIEVAVQCIEAAFNVSLANPSSELTQGPVVDLLSLVSNKPTTNKPLTDDMRQQADRWKNQGNEFIRQEKYKEALEAYNAAIEIDSNNAIYYCNRAAALNKLGNNEQALSDCFRSIEIDPCYSKVYGRLGAIYLSMDKVREALDAYKKAHTIDPNNENYTQSIKLCEERLHRPQATTNPTNVPNNFGSMFGNLLGGGGAGPDMASLLHNPALMNMATQFMQNPQVQGLMTSLVSNLTGQEGGPAGLETLLQAGQRMATELSANNPDLIETLRRNINPQSQSNQNNDSTSNSNNGSDQNRPSSS